MQRWQFLTSRAIPRVADLGGTEQAVLNLAATLGARGHAVSVGTGAAEADISVAVNDATLLRGASGLPVIWFHNEVSLWREWRRGRLPALWRHRPVAVFLGARQAAMAPALPVFRRRVVIGHGVPEAVLRAAPAGSPPAPQAVFLSQAYRGLAEVISVWRRLVAPAMPGARLSAFVQAREVGRYRALALGEASIAIEPRVGNAAIPEVLRGARVVLAPGHRSETFCLVAAEAAAIGVPVITRGWGALAERVNDGQTGFVCGSWLGFARRTLEVLGDAKLWRRLQAGGLATRADAGWDRAARAWEGLIDGG
jgi:glycosyltransferase involved in cell wall biosynthesis